MLNHALAFVGQSPVCRPGTLPAVQRGPQELDFRGELGSVLKHMLFNLICVVVRLKSPKYIAEIK
jgi:hypothetical protein